MKCTFVSKLVDFLCYYSYKKPYKLYLNVKGRTVVARVNGFLVCENTEFIKPPLNELEEKMSIIGPLSNGVLKYIPTHYTFSIVVSFDDIMGDTDRTIKVIFRLKDKVIVDTGVLNLEQIIKNNSMEGIVASMGFNNIDIGEEGEYSFDIYYKDKKIATYPFVIKKQ